MQINFSGHGIEVTPALRNYATEKFERLTRIGDKVTNINVIFSVEKMMQIVKATLHVFNTEIHAHSEAEDMYEAIDALADKLKLQITKQKEKHTEHHRDN